MVEAVDFSDKEVVVIRDWAVVLVPLVVVGIVVVVPIDGLEVVTSDKVVVVIGFVVDIGCGVVAVDMVVDGWDVEVVVDDVVNVGEGVVIGFDVVDGDVIGCDVVDGVVMGVWVVEGVDKVLVEGDVIGRPEVESGAAVGVDDVIVVDDVNGGIDAVRIHKGTKRTPCYKRKHVVTRCNTMSHVPF